MEVRSRHRWRSGAVLGLTLGLVGWSPPAPPAPIPAPLRLDESPALTLLVPYRRAAGMPPSLGTTWWRGESHESPLVPLVGRSAELLVAEPSTDWRSAPRVQLAEEFMPPWLQQLDSELAFTLVENAGCGVGGACSTSASFPAAAFASLWSALSPDLHPIPSWECREDRRVVVHRYGREQETFDRLVRCDGSIGPDALERLSLLARPPEAARPSALPEEPDPSAAPGEWVAGVRLLQPRLLWLVQRVADEFPGRPIYVYSGYRPASPEDGDHRSRHAAGRALDIAVEGIANEDLLSLCRELPDVGCGYYPNSRFVHVDVRFRGSGEALWIDTSAPSEPSRYVAEWPGVIESGRFVWERKVGASFLQAQARARPRPIAAVPR